MKSLSNLIFKTKSHGIMFDRDFILNIKNDAEKKKVSISRESETGMTYVTMTIGIK